MAKWALKANGQVVPRRTTRPLKVEEKHDPVEVKNISIFDALIEMKLGTAMKPPKLPIKDFDDEWEEFENDDEKSRSIPEIEDTVDAYGRLLNQQPAYENLIHNEIQLQLGENLQTVKVMQRSLGPDGVIVGTFDDNPALNSIVYDVEFPD